jgi:hypothetical protein
MNSWKMKKLSYEERKAALMKAMKNRQTHPKCTEQMLSNIPAEISRNQILIPCLLKFVQAEYVGVIFWAFLSGCLH